MQSQRNPAHARTPRVKVDGHRGIHVRQLVDGRKSYSICYADSDGKTVWQTIPGSLRDAIAARSKIVGRLHDGERIVSDRKIFADVAEEWFRKLNVGERTRESYESHLRIHLLPRIGSRRIGTITVDDVADVIAELRAEGKAGWTQKGVLTTLSSVMKYAARRGFIPFNPVSKLEKQERPKVRPREIRDLEQDEVTRVLTAVAEPYSAITMTAFFSGMRLMELLGLRWGDFEGGYIRVRNQLKRSGGLAPPKYDSKRDIVLVAEVAHVLRLHRLASPYSGDTDFVFAGHDGRPRNWRAVERGFDTAIERAGISSANRRKPTFHDTRHTFASLLISQRHDVVFVSRQLGHKGPEVTLRVYAHLFDRVKHEDAMRAGVGEVVGQVLRQVEAGTNGNAVRLP